MDNDRLKKHMARLPAIGSPRARLLEAKGCFGRNLDQITPRAAIRYFHENGIADLEEAARYDEALDLVARFGDAA